MMRMRLQQNLTTTTMVSNRYTATNLGRQWQLPSPRVQRPVFSAKGPNLEPKK
jgi:hypothetical protein